MIWAMRAGAIALILAGLLWLGQGLSLIPGSVMTGSTFWAVVGFICLLAGGFLAYRSFSGSARPPG